MTAPIGVVIGIQSLGHFFPFPGIIGRGNWANAGAANAIPKIARTDCFIVRRYWAVGIDDDTLVRGLNSNI